MNEYERVKAKADRMKYRQPGDLEESYFDEKAREEAEKAAAEAEERAKYQVDLTVMDREYDPAHFDDIGSITVTEGMLVVFDHEERTIAGYAPGGWMEFSLSRTDRVQSTDDEPKDDNGSEAAQ